MAPHPLSPCLRQALGREENGVALNFDTLWEYFVKSFVEIQVLELTLDLESCYKLDDFIEIEGGKLGEGR
jgi:hypothetical protein